MEKIVLKATGLKGRFNEYASIALKNGYVWDLENTELIETAIQSIEQNQFGVMMVGNPGSGKTLFLEIMQKIINPAAANYFLMVHVMQVVLEFNRSGSYVFSKWENTNVFFDDLYKEDKGQFYSDKNVEIFERFINIRYNLFKSKKLKTHFTTNHSRTELLNRYGLYCITRLEEMCDKIRLGADKDYTNRRQYRNFIYLPNVHYEKIKTKEDLEWEKYYANYKNAHIEKTIHLPQHIKKGKGTLMKERLGNQIPETLIAKEIKKIKTNK